MAASIFNGSKVKILKDRLVSFSDKDMIVVQSDDPTSSAVSATKGTILINPTSAAIYKKNDDGLSTNWTLLDFDASNEFSQLKNLGLAASVGSSALTIDLKQSDGSTDPSSGNPVIVGFRNATSTTGGYDLVSITGALTMTVPSGATLGAADGVLRKNWIYLINNAGAAELAISSIKFEDDGIISTTALSSGSDSSSVIYSTSARSNVPVRLIGFLESTQTTAGTWASSPSKLFAGQIFAGEKVRVEASSNTAGNVTAAGNDFVAEDVSEDTHNAYNASTGEFTLPKTGTVKISVRNMLASTTLSTTQFLSAIVQKDTGGGYSSISRISKIIGSGGATTYHINGSDSFSANKGDVFKIQLVCSVSTTLNGTTLDNRLIFEMD